MHPKISQNMKELKQQLNDSLYKNSLYIMFTSIINSSFSFAFWTLAAKLCTQQNVGLATAMTSSITFLVLLLHLGLDYSTIRFLPEGRQR